MELYPRSLTAPAATDKLDDFNLGVAQNGLFWTAQIPDQTVGITDNGMHAVLDVRNLPAEDQPKFPKSTNPTYAALMTFHIEWDGYGQRLGFTDPKNHFQLRFYNAMAHGTFEVHVPATGLTFTSNAANTSISTFAAINRERNGSFFQNDPTWNGD